MGKVVIFDSESMETLSALQMSMLVCTNTATDKVGEDFRQSLRKMQRCSDWLKCKSTRGKLHGVSYVSVSSKRYHPPGNPGENLQKRVKS